MEAFLKDYGAVINAAVASARSDLGLPSATQEDLKFFGTVAAFLHDNPQLFSWRGKNKPDSNSGEHLIIKAKKFFGARAKTDYPAPPGTKPDQMVSVVMQVVYGYPESDAMRMELEHQHAMSSENIVGALLERYIAYTMEAHGWVWCAGDFVKAVDFIKWTANGWSAVQVKNRDNTENSSSSAIRNGTDIDKWFRGFSKTGATNWENFPDAESKSHLSEEGFRAFVIEYLKKAKKS